MAVDVSALILACRRAFEAGDDDGDDAATTTKRCWTATPRAS